MIVQGTVRKNPKLVNMILLVWRKHVLQGIDYLFYYRLSLQDLSTLPRFPLKSKSNISLGTVPSKSMLTVTSVSKSKDTGLPRSLSCLSLNSEERNYSHIQSKVKEYIKNINDESDIKNKISFQEV